MGVEGQVLRRDRLLGGGEEEEAQAERLDGRARQPQRVPVLAKQLLQAAGASSSGVSSCCST